MSDLLSVIKARRDGLASSLDSFNTVIRFLEANGHGNGTKPAKIPTVGRQGKFTTTEVMDIRNRLAGKVPVKTIAKKFGVSDAMIYGIKNGKYYAHVR